DGGEQHSGEFREANPQGLVPVLQHGNRTLRQSLAILAYLDETSPAPMLLPSNARGRQRLRPLAQLIARDENPVNQLRALQSFDQTRGVPQPEREEWVRHWMREGLAAFEAMLGDHPATGEFCEG